MKTGEIHTYDNSTNESTRISRRPHKVLKKLRIVSGLIEETTQELDSVLQICKLPSDLDLILPRLRQKQRKLAHYARRLDVHISLHEDWVKKNGADRD